MQLGPQVLAGIGQFFTTVMRFAEKQVGARPGRVQFQRALQRQDRAIIPLAVQQPAAETKMGGGIFGRELDGAADFFAGLFPSIHLDQQVR